MKISSTSVRKTQTDTGRSTIYNIQITGNSITSLIGTMFYIMKSRNKLHITLKLENRRRLRLNITLYLLTKPNVTANDM